MRTVHFLSITFQCGNMCIQPLILKNKLNRGGKNVWTTPVPCGKCPQCVKAKLNAWLFRIGKEMEISSNPLFITLTYNDENIPRSENGLLTLSKRDVQLFMKRLRKEYAKISDKKIRYYFVGEYGSKFKRPHYHAILFNLDNPDLVHPAWGNGFTYTPPVRNGGISYVIKYISKPRTKLVEGDDRQREFSLMSQGLGKTILPPEYENTIMRILKIVFSLFRTESKCPCRNTIRTSYMTTLLDRWLPSIFRRKLIICNSNKLCVICARRVPITMLPCVNWKYQNIILHLKNGLKN